MRIFILFFIFIAVTLFYQEAESQVKAKTIWMSIENELKKIRSLSPQAKVGFTLLSPDGKILYRQNDHEKLVPASTLKIYTTGAALDLLGSNFKFYTHLEYDGFIDKCGVLNGNIYVRGTGDPTLGSERVPGVLPLGELINLFADKLQAEGITKVNGSIIGDDTFFQECLTPESWLYKDRANYFGAAPSGLSINENSYKLFFKPGTSIGSKTEIVGTDPVNIPDFKLENKVTTYYKGSGDRAVIMLDSITGEKEVIGTIPAGVNSFAIRGSVSDPGKLTAQLLIGKLTDRNFEITGKAYSGFCSPINKKTYRNLIYTHSSPLLLDIIKQINFRSHNLFAETLIITLGKAFRGIGDYKNGFKVVLDYWQSEGVDIQKSELYDGSGLSPLNKISTNILAEMLFTIKSDSTFANFLATLPVAGETGTVKYFCSNNSAKGKVFVKSGSIEGVKSYAGYALNKSDQLLPFAIFVNNFEGNQTLLKQSLERLMATITNIP